MLQEREQSALPSTNGVYTGIDPVAFLETDMFISYSRAPLMLHPRQRAVLREMFRRNERGLVYDMLIYSATKKSGKTTIGGGLALWHAFRKPYGEVYIVGNDLKQADNRMAQSLRECIQLNPRMQHIRLAESTYKVKLPNGCRIESLPVDPTGEAGMNPDAIFWTEAWGAKMKKHELMWSEAALSPTKSNESFIFVESYAGHSGESLILENLYENTVKRGRQLELYDDAGNEVPEVYVNGRAICYWCTEHYLSWQQNPEYYKSEETRMTPSEFRRVHWNEWTTGTDSYVDVGWWDSCLIEGMPTPPDTPEIMALDAGVTSDHFACVTVTKRGGKTQAAYAREWIPQAGRPLDFGTIEDEIVRYCETHNVLEIVYDPHQLVQMAQRLRKRINARIHPFDQGGRRADADTLLRQKIMNRELEHDGNPVLRRAVTNADGKSTDDSKLRIVKRHEALKIDPLVALSMASKRAEELALERFSK